MSNGSDQEEEIAQLELLIRTERRRLWILEQQRTKYGELAVPAHLKLEIEDTERKIAMQQAELRRLRPVAVADRAPYVGLNTFTESDAERFFGRDLLVADLAAQAGHAAFLTVLGPSGVGKSSVVRAGVIPMLKGGALPGSEKWIYCAPLRPGSQPLNSLAAALLTAPGTAALGNIFELQTNLATRDDALLIAAAALLSARDGARVVLVVDQAEELWTFAPPKPVVGAAFESAERDRFINHLLAAAGAPDAPVLIILTMRADFLHRAAEHAALAERIGAHLKIISPMTPDELRAAIERPAAAAGCAFEPGLVHELIEQTSGRAGALPLLEYTLLELWNRREPDGLLTWNAYRELGEIEGALARRAEALFDRFPDQQDALRALFLRLVAPADGLTGTRRRVSLADLVPVGGSVAAVQALIEPLVSARLLTTAGDDDRDEHAEPATVEIAHEALISAWPRLKHWIDSAQEDLRFQLRVEAAAHEWFGQPAPTDYLWRGVLLDRAEEWRRDAQPQLNEHERQFLDACRAERQRELARAKARAADKLATQRLRTIGGGAVGAALGYCCGLLYATLSASAGPLLLGHWNVSWFTLVFLSLVLLATGSMVGVCLAVGFGYTSRRRWQALTTTSIGAVAGSIIYLLLALYFLAGQNEALLYLLPGALLGAGLGLGLSAVDVPLRIRAVSWRWQRIGATALGGTLAAGAAYATGYFARDLVSALVSGLIFFGGFTGAGFAFGGPVDPALGDEEHL